MKDIYIYPTYTPERDKSGNLYLKFFEDAFKSSYNVTNRKGKLGIVSNLFNLDAKCYIYQWIDLVPFKQHGLIQSLIFVICLTLVKFLKRKIVLVVHNKCTHKLPTNKLDSIKLQIVEILMSLVVQFSDSIIVHAKEGVSFLNKKYPKVDRSKIKYIPHPVYRDGIVKSDMIKWDYIVWGGISRHKNIHSLLELISKSDALKKRSFLLCGKCSDVEYLKKLEQLIPDNVEFINKFVTDLELEKYISHSRSILFTYKLDSVLSSGALVYSLNFGKKIIGPNGGSFMDIEGIVECYNDIEEIEKIDIYNKVSIEPFVQYIDNNKWLDFPAKVMRNNLGK